MNDDPYNRIFNLTATTNNKTKSMNDTISSRIFNKKHQPIGIVIAVKQPLKLDQRIRVGWSLACKKDRFNKELGLKIAVNRALTDKPGRVPNSIVRNVESMVTRAERYFKGQNVVNPVS